MKRSFAKKKRGRHGGGQMRGEGHHRNFQYSYITIIHYFVDNIDNYINNNIMILREYKRRFNEDKYGERNHRLKIQ